MKLKLFGPSQEEIWKQLSEQIGARFQAASFRKVARVTADVGAWTVTLDTYTVSTGKSTTRFTRMRTPYVNVDGFRFTVYGKSPFSALGKALGMQDIEIGDRDFDDRFIVKSNNESRARSLFAGPRLRELLAAHPEVRLEVRDDEGWFGPKFPDGVDELRLQTHGVIRDLDKLRSLFELFSEALRQLCRIGAAYEDDPAVEL